MHKHEISRVTKKVQADVSETKPAEVEPAEVDIMQQPYLYNIIPIKLHEDATSLGAHYFTKNLFSG